MSEHIVEVHNIGPDTYPGASVGTITIRPPINAGKLFSFYVTGGSETVLLEEIVSTSEVTAFVAKSLNGDEERQHSDIQAIADRMSKLVAHPESARELLNEDPFGD